VEYADGLQQAAAGSSLNISEANQLRQLLHIETVFRIPFLFIEKRKNTKAAIETIKRMFYWKWDI
jgi:hypothetical protein